MLDLNDLILFARLADLKSISATAVALRRPKSTISRSMDRLEAQLGTKLLTRSSRGLVLTDAGFVLLDHCRILAHDVEEAVAAMSYQRAEPRGRVRVSAPFAFGQRFLAPIVARFLERHPHVTLVLELDNRRVDIVRDGFDIAIRVGPLEDSGLMARRLGTSPLLVYAAPEYLVGRDLPAEPEALAAHALLDIRTADGPKEWRLVGPTLREARFSVQPRFAANDPTSLCAAAVAGLGVALLPAFLGQPEVAAGRLVRLLPDWSLPAGDFHAVFPSRRVPLPVRAFIDFMVEELAGQEPWRIA